MKITKDILSIGQFSAELDEGEWFDATKTYVNKVIRVKKVILSSTMHSGQTRPDRRVTVYGNRVLKDGTEGTPEHERVTFWDDVKKKIPAGTLSALLKQEEAWRASLS